MHLQLNFAGLHYNLLKDHLYPGDGKEAIAVAICGRHQGEAKSQLFVHQVVLIPHSECRRNRDLIVWPTERIVHFFNMVAVNDFAILKIHSHPGGLPQFSKIDNDSDHEFFDSVFGWSNTDNPHASAIMLPSGEIIGRLIKSDQSFAFLDEVVVAGDEIVSYGSVLQASNVEGFSVRTVQAFGDRTYQELKHLKIGIVGCSGTGSPVIAQLARLGVRDLVFVDPDIIEEKNLNRILYSTRTSADLKQAKVDVIKKGVQSIGLGTNVTTFQANLFDDIDCIRQLIECDVIFGCMDSVDGRHLLNQLATFYLKPYFDLGVKLEADGKGGISKICGSVHYLQPGKSSLITRGVYTVEDLRAASQLRQNANEYENLVKNSYIKNINVNSPAVISVNMLIASHAINEFLNRLHPYKAEIPSKYSLTTIDLTENYICNVDESDFEIDAYLLKKVGRGDMIPLLEMCELQ
jgi:hypothetical protein